MPADNPPGLVLALAAAKQRLRRDLLRRCLEVGPRQAEGAARAVAHHLAADEVFQRAGRVALYASLPGELSTAPLFGLLLELRKIPLLPRMMPERGLEFAPCLRWEELRPGRYGVLEPPAAVAAVALGSGDLVCVPGLAFDRRGNRLGRGKGYYDRSLARLGEGPRLLGLAYDLQLLGVVPHGPDDRPVHGVVTESGSTLREGPER